MSWAGGIELPENLCSMSGVSREGVLEWPSELGLKEEPDCLESRPPTGSWCSVMVKDGVEECRTVGGLRCWKPLEPLGAGRGAL
jgi:hypothetical protein